VSSSGHNFLNTALFHEGEFPQVESTSRKVGIELMTDEALAANVHKRSQGKDLTQFLEREVWQM